MSNELTIVIKNEGEALKKLLSLLEKQYKHVMKKELDNSYREINRIILAVKQQKETNELLIRQQMSFNNQILNIINPRREMKTYNSYGNLSR